MKKRSLEGYKIEYKAGDDSWELYQETGDVIVAIHLFDNCKNTHRYVPIRIKEISSVIIMED